MQCVPVIVLYLIIYVCNFKVRIKKLRLKIMSDRIQETAEIDEKKAKN